MVAKKQSKLEGTNGLWEKAKQAGLSRRNFLGLMAAGGATAVLAACGSKVTTTVTTTVPASGTAAATATKEPTIPTKFRGRRPGGTKTELLYWNKDKAYNGYTLFASGRSYLIDMQGKVVNTWNIGTNPRLLPNGHLYDSAPSKSWQEQDWDGKVVWQYSEKRADYAPHHDWVRIYNPKLKKDTFMYIANKTVPQDQAIAAGADPKTGPYNNGQMDAIVEVDLDGNIIWEWWFFDHVIQDIDSTKANYVGTGKKISDYPGRININMPGRPLRGDWLHCNSMDYNQELDQIVTNSVQGEFYVIDHGNTFVPGDPKKSIELAAGPAGDFLYRFGDPARYGQGNPPSIQTDWTRSTQGHKQIGGTHDIHWIPKGCPGAGNFLIHVNGQYLFEATPQSYVFEINGYLDSKKVNTGKYVNPPDAGYYTWSDANQKDTHKVAKQASNQIVSMYYTLDNTAFFNHIGGSAQRLPNGNILNCDDVRGHLFEVTDKGELVWDYISPVFGPDFLEWQVDCVPMVNSIFRSRRYGTDYPAFAGRTLTPKGTILELFKK